VTTLIRVMQYEADQIQLSRKLKYNLERRDASPPHSTLRIPITAMPKYTICSGPTGALRGGK